MDSSRYHELLNGVEEISNSKMMIVNHQMKVYKYANNNGDNNNNVGNNKDDFFVVDLENVTNGVISPNSSSSRTIKLQRNFSRKTPHRIDRKLDNKDVLAPSSSPRVTTINKSEQSSLHTATTQPTGSSHDNSINNSNLPQHQITIKTGDKNTILEEQWGRRSSFKRSPPSWIYDPKRILLFFATMSSMGTLLLIYFTLSINRRAGN